MEFLGKLGNSKVFPPKIRWSPKKKKKKKKKRSSPKLRLIFRPKSEIQTFEGGLFSNGGGGLFSIFHKKSASKAPKTCDCAYFTSQWGGSSPPAPLATLLVGIKVRGKGTEYSGSEFFGGPVLVEACTYNSGETQAQNMSKELCFLIFTQNLKEKQAQFEWRHFLCFLWCSSKSEG